MFKLFEPKSGSRNQWQGPTRVSAEQFDNEMKSAPEWHHLLLLLLLLSASSSSSPLSHGPTSNTSITTTASQQPVVASQTRQLTSKPSHSVQTLQARKSPSQATFNQAIFNSSNLQIKPFQVKYRHSKTSLITQSRVSSLRVEPQ